MEDKNYEEISETIRKTIVSKTNEMNKSGIVGEGEGKKEKKAKKEKERKGAKDRGVVVPADDEVALLLSLNTTRGSWANSDRSETARRLTPSIPMGAHKTRALGGPEPPLASSTLVQPIINKACLGPNVLYTDIPASACRIRDSRGGAHILFPRDSPRSLLPLIEELVEKSICEIIGVLIILTAFLIHELTNRNKYDKRTYNM